LYYLEGSDANGMFTPSVSNATTFFGGNVDAAHGGRSGFVLELNRDNTGGVGNDSARTAMILVRAMLTLPADLATAKPDDIKVAVLDTLDLNATAADILFPAGTAGITGLAVGRTVGATGPRVLYTADYDVLRPMGASRVYESKLALAPVWEGRSLALPGPRALPPHNPQPHPRPIPREDIGRKAANETTGWWERKT
jgi:hypothetical protein